MEGWVHNNSGGMGRYVSVSVCMCVCVCVTEGRVGM